MELSNSHCDAYITGNTLMRLQVQEDIKPKNLTTVCSPDAENRLIFAGCL